MPQAPSLFRCFSFPDWNSSKYPKLKVAATSAVEKVISKLILSISPAHLWRHRSLDPWNRIFVFVFFFREVDSFFFHPTTSISSTTSQVYFYCLLSSFISLVTPFSSPSLIRLQTLFIAKVMFDCKNTGVQHIHRWRVCFHYRDANRPPSGLFQRRRCFRYLPLPEMVSTPLISPLSLLPLGLLLHLLRLYFFPKSYIVNPFKLRVSPAYDSA